jgi:hypothetical protein
MAFTGNVSWNGPEGPYKLDPFQLTEERFYE